MQYIISLGSQDFLRALFVIFALGALCLSQSNIHFDVIFGVTGMAAPVQKSWLDVLAEVRDWQRPLQDQGYPIWYRGQSNAGWSVRSSLHRHIINSFERVGILQPPSDASDLLRDVYVRLYYKFKSRAWRFLEVSERSPWGIVFSMQHHGLPTLLLDWTESFACAVYFAQQRRNPEVDAALFLLNPQRLNYESLSRLEEIYRRKGKPLERLIFGEGLIPVGESLDQANYSSYFHPDHSLFRGLAGRAAPEVYQTVAVVPFFSNPRMSAQQAAFTLSGMSFEPLEEQFGEDVLKKVVLPASTYKETKEFLELVGIGHFGYFPDIDNLVRDLNGDLENELEKAAELLKNENG